MTRMGTRPNSSACSWATRPTRRQLARVADHDEVVRHVRVGLGADAVDVGHEAVHRGHRIAADARSPGRPDAPRRARWRARSRRHRDRGSRGRWRGSPRRPAADPRPPAGTVARSAGRQRHQRRVSRHTAHPSAPLPPPAGAGRAAVLARRAAPGRPASAPAPATPRRPSRGGCLRALLQVVEDLEHAGATLRRVVLAQVQLRDALQAQVAQPMPHERHRPAQRPHRRPDGSAASPMTETHTLAWLSSRSTSTLVTVTNPMRGSAISRAMMALISSRSSSSSRSVR